ncbi:hypothetical protein ACFLU3_02105 [Chloroflexota bacterium]
MRKTKKTQSNTQELRVKSVKFVPAPDAEHRLQQVFTLLLRNNREEATDAETSGH